MPGAGREIELRLYRDALSTPWGFRLQGGKDLKTSLIIQKVTLGTPADGDLQRGDVILEIQKSNAAQLTHKQAQDLITNAGGSMVLKIRRSGHQEYIPPPLPILRPSSHKPYIPPRTVPQYGTDYNSPSSSSLPSPTVGPQSGFMLNRVQNSLNSTGAWTPDYDERSFSPMSTPSSEQSSTKYPTWAPRAQPVHPTGLWEPGWTPRPNQPRPYTSPVNRPQYNPVQHLEYEDPPWIGTLKSATQPHSSDSHLGQLSQRVHSVSPVYQKTLSDGPSTAPVQALNLQYNSPLGLYSRSSAQEAMSGQMHGVQTQDALSVQSDSHVYEMVQNEDNARHGTRRSRPSSRVGATVVQSPSMRILESHLNVGKESELGTSDF